MYNYSKKEWKQHLSCLFHSVIKKKLGQRSGPSYFMVGLSIQTCCGNEACVVLSARLQEY